MFNHKHRLKTNQTKNMLLCDASKHNKIRFMLILPIYFLSQLIFNIQISIFIPNPNYKNRVESHIIQGVP